MAFGLAVLCMWDPSLLFVVAVSLHVLGLFYAVVSIYDVDLAAIIIYLHAMMYVHHPYRLQNTIIPLSIKT